MDRLIEVNWRRDDTPSGMLLIGEFLRLIARWIGLVPTDASLIILRPLRLDT